MTHLTNAMASARSDHYGSNLKFWFPCDDGSGNNIVDRIGGLIISDSGTATHNEPHSVSILATANSVVSGLENIQIPRKGLIVFIEKVATSFALSSLVLGNSSGDDNISLSGANVAMKFDSITSSAAVSSTAAAGQIMCLAAAWDADNLYSYEGLDADASLQNTTALNSTIKAALDAGQYLTNGQATLNISARSSAYGIAMFDFSNDGLPSDLLTGINWMKDQWTGGRKLIYPEWVDRT